MVDLLQGIAILILTGTILTQQMTIRNILKTQFLLTDAIFELNRSVAKVRR